MTVVLEEAIAPAIVAKSLSADDVVDDEDDELDEEDREYKYDNLSDQAKDNAREWFITSDYDYFDSDALEESFRESIEMSGFDVSKVYFSLSYCQGDGVAFEGRLDIRRFLNPEDTDYTPSPESKEPARWTRNSHSNFVALRTFLKKYECFADALTIKVETRSYGGSHLHSMKTDVYLDDSERSEPDDYTARELILFKQIEASLPDLESHVTDVWRTMIAWLERDGYDEVEYQHSDEVVEEAMDPYDFTFDVNGRRFD
jgi:hypothetical protein